MGNTEVIAALIQEGCALDRQDKVRREVGRVSLRTLFGTCRAREMLSFLSQLSCLNMRKSAQGSSERVSDIELKKNSSLCSVAAVGNHININGEEKKSRISDLWRPGWGKGCAPASLFPFFFFFLKITE